VDIALGSNLLRVAGLNCNRSGRAILHEVAFTVRSGEILGLIGPNGSGKSTLFECLAGLLPCTASVELEGRSSAPSQRSRSLFYVPDAIRPWPAQTVLWTLRMQSLIFGIDPGRAGKLLDDLDLRDLQHHSVGSLSKGEAKRLTMLLGLLSPQPLLLLDEPFDGLDLRQTHRAMDLLRTVTASGRTLLLSIHQLTDAARMCDRFVLLSHGKSVAEGTLEELSSRAGTHKGDLEEVFLALT
jgi:ABC-2 type transport system ATP-binding protein